MVPLIRTSLPCFAVLASLAVLATPVGRALGDDNRSTPVTVVNPATNPALTSSVDNPGRIPYQSTSETGSCSAGGTGAVCEVSFPNTVPKGHRLVVQHVSASTFFTDNPAGIIVKLRAGSPGTTPSLFMPGPDITFVAQATNIVGRFGGISFGSFFDHSVLFFLDEGGSPLVDIFWSNFSVNGSPGPTTLIGYLLDCKAGPCAPIAE